MYSFNMSIVPSLWLKFIIVPVPKGDNKDPSAPLNYRGITLLSCVSKVYTALLNKRITNYVEHTNLFVEEQGGFRKGRSLVETPFW